MRLQCGFERVNLQRPAPCGARPRVTRAAQVQGLTLVHVRVQLEQLQDTLMSYVGLYGGQKSPS